MKLTAIKTAPVLANSIGLLEFVDRYVTDMPEQSVLAISSKVVSLCEGRVEKFGGVTKTELARREAQYFLSPEHNPYHICVTVNRDIMVASAGIDESNGGGYYVLWPEDPQASVNRLREHLRAKYGHPVGVLMTDGRITPLRRGAIGVGLAHSGFKALRDYAGTPDVFGKVFGFTIASILDGLAAAAVVVMGEGGQTTPLVLMEEVDCAQFQDRNPTEAEVAELRVTLEQDIYADMFRSVPWEKRPGKD